MGYALEQTHLAWDGLRLLQEQRHRQVSLYVYENESHEPLARVDGPGDGAALQHVQVS
jgi:phage gp29-like protein